MPFKGQMPSVSTGAWVYHAAPEVKSFYSDNKSGKWCISCEMDEVDDAWRRICDLLDRSEIHVAKVSTRGSMRFSGFTTHLICVYTLDWSDESEIARVRQVLFDVGFDKTMGYKRDIDTMNPQPGQPEFIYHDVDFLDPAACN